LALAASGNSARAKRSVVCSRGLTRDRRPTGARRSDDSRRGDRQLDAVAATTSSLTIQLVSEL
jgi:hypothetical protein